MVDNYESASDNDFFYDHLGAYLSYELSYEDQARFKSIIESRPDLLEKVELYKERKNRLISDGMRVQLTSTEMTQLFSKIQVESETQEESTEDFEEIIRREGDRALSITSLLFAICVMILFVYLIQSRPDVSGKSFDPIASLDYESFAHDENPSRLNFPSSSFEEIRKYVTESRDLGFSPRLDFGRNLSDWLLEGASVLDYGFKKIMLIQYVSKDREERVFYYNMEGNLSELKSANNRLSSIAGVRIYSGESMNHVVWAQPSQKTYSVLTGRSKVERLLGIAQSLGAPAQE